MHFYDAKISEILTSREREVLQLLADGYSNMEVAEILNISVRTVKFHTTNIYEKIEVCSRSAAIAWAWKNRDLLGLS